MPEKEERLIYANTLLEGISGMSDLEMNGVTIAVAVAKCPTIDPESLRLHGKPVPHYKSLCNSDGEPIITHPFGYECPFCGDPDIKKFCPNCGALMEE